MKNRLKMAKELLSNNGSIYVQIDYNEVHYLKILMDEIFGKDNFIREIIWDRKNSSGGKAAAQNWIHVHDNILYYVKDKNNFVFNKQYEHYSKEYIKFRFRHEDDKGRYRLQGSNNRRQYLSDSKGKAYTSVWDIADVNVMALERVFRTQKPEALLQRIISASTNEGDIVLDFFSGSGSTGAVAHKMGRQYILIEQLENQLEILNKRLKKVISGEQGGISKSINWKGEGDFVYMELAKWNEEWIEKIEKAKNSKELVKLWKEMKETAFLSYKVEPKKIDVSTKGFNDLSIEDQKKFLMECLDKNQLYVNYSEIEDKEYGVSSDDKKFNKEFYES